MDFTQELDKVVNLEFTREDLSLLRDLLKVECLYQIRVQLEKKIKVNEQVLALANVFDVYRTFDDSLEDLDYLSKKYEETGDSTKNVFIVKKISAKMYRMLLTETVKDPLPDFILSKIEKTGKTLLDKINLALKDDFTMENNPLLSKSRANTQEDTSSSPIAVNILGIKGIA